MAGFSAELTAGARVRGGGASSRPRWGNCSPNSPGNCSPRRHPGSSASGFRGALQGGLMSSLLSGLGRGLVRSCGGCSGCSSAGRWTESWGGGLRECPRSGFRCGFPHCLPSSGRNGERFSHESTKGTKRTGEAERVGASNAVSGARRRVERLCGQVYACRVRPLFRAFRAFVATYSSVSVVRSCELLAVGCGLSAVSGRCRGGGRCGARR